MTPLEKVLSRLPDAKESGSGHWQAKCPAHDDRTASLSVSEGREGRALVRCFANCSFEEIVAALRLEAWELFGNGSPSLKVTGPGPGVEVGNPVGRPPRPIAAEYNYVDADGRLLYQVVRYIPKDFRQRRPDGNGGWIWDLKNVERVLYNLPDVLSAISDSETVYLVEGEKDADNLISIGLVATTNAGGARKWDKQFTLDLTGARIVIIPDNDAAGKDHAKKVAAQLNGTALSIRILELPKLPPKGDVSDWLDSGGSREELEELIDSAPVWKPPTTPGEEGYKQNFQIEEIERVGTDPPIYHVTVQGKRVRMSIDQLMNFNLFSKVVAQNTNHVPDMTNHQVNWKPYIHERLNNARVDVEAPDDTSEEAMIFHSIVRYLSDKAEEDETMIADMRGPYKNERLIYFHGPTMHRFLSTRGMRIEPTALWDVIRRRGATAVVKWVHDSEKRGKKMRVWSIEKKTIARYLGDAESEQEDDCLNEEM